MLSIVEEMTVGNAIWHHVAVTYGMLQSDQGQSFFVLVAPWKASNFHLSVFIRKENTTGGAPPCAAAFRLTPGPFDRTSVSEEPNMIVSGLRKDCIRKNWTSHSSQYSLSRVYCLHIVGFNTSRKESKQFMAGCSSLMLHSSYSLQVQLASSETVFCSKRNS